MAPDQPQRAAGHRPRSDSWAGRHRGTFALLLALVFCICLIVWMAWDPSERAALQGEMRRLQYLHYQEKSLAYEETNNLRATILGLQQTLRDTQQELLMAQHALGQARQANDALVASGRTITSAPAAGTGQPAPAAPAVGPVQPAAPESDAARLARMQRDLESIRQAIRNNAADYTGLSRALAETKRSLALTRQAASADAVGQTRSAGVALAEWPLDQFLTEAELAAQEAATKATEAGTVPAPPDPVAVAREMTALNRQLIAIQEQLGEGQKKLGALQEELRAAMASAAR